MPLYEYVCYGCETSFERRVPVADADQTTCPHCGSQYTKRLLPRIALQVQSVSSFGVVDTATTCSSDSCCGNMCGVGNPH